MIQIMEMPWIKYNANKDDKYKGDCSIRALSLAYNLPYAEVQKELKSQVYGDGGWVHYNSNVNIEEFIKKHGCEQPFQKISKCTVEEFCEDHPVGTYLVYTGSNGGNVERGGEYDDMETDHIICIIDGDNYDSWDSSNQYVKNYCIVNSKGSDLASNVTARYSMEDINAKAYKALQSAIEAYITANNGKAFNLLGWDGVIYNDGRAYRSWGTTTFFWMVVKDIYTVVIGYHISTEAEDMPKGFEAKVDNKVHDGKFALKFSPKATNDEIDSIINKDIPSAIKKLANALKKEQELYNKLTSEDVFADYPNLDLEATFGRYSRVQPDKLYDLLRNCNSWVKEHVREVWNSLNEGYELYCVPDDADSKKGRITGHSTVDGVTKDHYALIHFTGKNAKQINACCDLYLKDLKEYGSAEIFYDYRRDVLSDW